MTPREPRESKPPLSGTARTSVIPEARVTGMCSLEGEDRRRRDYVRVVGAGLGGIDGGVYGADFAEAHLRDGIEEAGINLQAFARR